MNFNPINHQFKYHHELMVSFKSYHELMVNFNKSLSSFMMKN